MKFGPVCFCRPPPFPPLYPKAPTAKAIKNFESHIFCYETFRGLSPFLTKVNKDLVNIGLKTIRYVVY